MYAISELEDYQQELAKAVFEQLEPDDDEHLKGILNDVVNHGANTGWMGFSWNTDNEAFVKKNIKNIKKMCWEMAENEGVESLAHFVKAFNELDKNEDITLMSIEKVVFDFDETVDYYTDIINHLAWFALEETARLLVPEE